MLQVTDLKKGFGSGSRRLEVLKGINMKVKAGELVSLMGPSGCGTVSYTHLTLPTKA